MRLRDILYILALVTAFVSCSEYDMEDPYDQKNDQDQIEYARTMAVSIELQYNLSTKAPAYICIYDRKPGNDLTDSDFVPDESIQPFFTGFTNVNGALYLETRILKDTKTLYFYSPSFFAPTLLVADIIDGKVVLTYNEEKN